MARDTVYPKPLAGLEILRTKNEESKDYCKADSEQRELFFHNNISAGHTSSRQVYRCNSVNEHDPIHSHSIYEKKIVMGKRDRCAVFRCNNDRLFPEKYTLKFSFCTKARVNTERVPPRHPIILLKSNKFNMATVSVKRRDQGRFPFSPKFRKFRLEIKWNRPFRFGPNGISGTTFQGQSKNVPFHLTKLLSPVPLFSILLTRTTVPSNFPSGMWNFRNFTFLEWKAQVETSNLFLGG